MADKSFDPSVFLKDGVPSDPSKAPKKGQSPTKKLVDKQRGAQAARQAEMRAKTIPKAKSGGKAAMPDFKF